MQELKVQFVADPWESVPWWELKGKGLGDTYVPPIGVVGVGGLGPLKSKIPSLNDFVASYKAKGVDTSNPTVLKQVILAYHDVKYPKKGASLDPKG